VDHRPGTEDGKPAHRDLLEMPVSSDKGVGVRGYSQRDEVVVLRIVRHHTRWIDRVIEQDAFVGESARKGIRLLPGDVVPLGDPRMQKCLPDLVDELRAGDQLKLTVLPEIDQLRGGPGGRQGPRDDAVGVDDDSKGQDFLLTAVCALTS